MSGQTEEHLSPEVIRQLVDARLARECDAESSGEGLEDSKIHLSVCAACQYRFDRATAATAGLFALRAQADALPGRGCPPEEVWRGLTAGLPPEAERVRMMKHASECDACGRRLGQALDDSEPSAPGEEELLQALERSRLRRATELAGLSAPARTPQRIRAKRLPWWIAAAAAVLAAGAFWIVSARRAEPPMQLLAQAYTENRIIEARIPLARYSPLRTKRAGDSSLPSEPLVEAEYRIIRGLKAGANRAAWLQAKGRSELLSSRFDDAIATLKEALQLDPDSASLKTDLAAAYFERAESQHRAIDYGQSIELLGQSLAKNQHDPIALYNRALAYERTKMYSQAIADWEEYLRIEPSGEWANDVRGKLEAARRLIGARTPWRPEDPPRFLARLSTPPERVDGTDTLELDLDVAVKDWLPAAFESGSDSSTARAAVSRLAQQLSQRREQWLSQVMEARMEPPLVQAVVALSAAARGNAADRYEEALSLARHSAALFRRAGLPQAEARARFEETYALQRSTKSSGCAKAATEAAALVDPSRNVWLAAQFDLERASCLGQLGQLGPALEAAQAALTRLSGAHFPSLYLRALGFSASIHTVMADYAAAWTKDVEGLTGYWAGQYPPARAYQFYDDMSFWAEESGHWHLALALAREAVGAIASAGKPSVHALARFQLGKVAVMAGSASEAQEAFADAARLFSSVEESNSKHAAQVDGQIGVARLESRRGDLRGALTRLEGVQSQLEGLNNFLISIRYHQTLSEVYRARGDMRSSEAALRPVMAIAERGLRSIQDPRGRLLWNRETSEPYRRFVELALRSHGDPREALEIWEWYRAAALRGGEGSSGAGKADPATAGEESWPREASLVRDALPGLTGETILTFAVLESGVAAWAYDNNGIESQWIGVPAPEIARLAGRFIALCSDPSSPPDQLREQGRRLYDLLIRPFAGRFQRGRTLVIDADGELGHIPMQALVLPTGQYLGQDYAVAFLPGIGYLRALRPALPLERSLHAVVVGSPALPAELQAVFAPLPDSGAEASAVAGMFSRSTLLTGSEATRETVLRELGDAAVFHFAGHSFATVGRTGLLLAPGSSASAPAILSSDDFTAAAFRTCRLAVLSTCSTEKLGQESGADPFTLVRALLAAGVPHVVAARWNVDSSATRALMEAFYSHVLARRPVAEALRDAAAGVRSAPARSHPYYWSGFSIFGRG